MTVTTPEFKILDLTRSGVHLGAKGEKVLSSAHKTGGLYQELPWFLCARDIAWPCNGGQHQLLAFHEDGSSLRGLSPRSANPVNLINAVFWKECGKGQEVEGDSETNRLIDTKERKVEQNEGNSLASECSTVTLAFPVWHVITCVFYIHDRSRIIWHLQMTGSMTE